ncbi:MAG: translation initiation factor IF-2 N-terminal domain-containing protein, partial [Deltaproteobacteria bacterium]|nr:translation initiation factor IF-2 N-terminal domain-containing protein [Deltaproteobacteria bacterium]
MTMNISGITGGAGGAGGGTTPPTPPVATKMRVYEVAREVGVANKDLVQKIRALGIEVNNHMSVLDPEDVMRVRRALDKERQESLIEERIQPTVIRRRSKGGPPAPQPRPAADGAEAAARVVTRRPVVVEEPTEEPETAPPVEAAPPSVEAPPTLVEVPPPPVEAHAEVHAAAAERAVAEPPAPVIEAEVRHVVEPPPAPAAPAVPSGPRIIDLPLPRIQIEDRDALARAMRGREVVTRQDLQQ